MRPTCRRHSKLCIIEPVATGLRAVANTMQPWKELRLMIHAKVFPGWENLEAFLAHIRFIEGHLQKVQKLAIVSDNHILTEVPKIAAHLVHAEVKHFPESEYEAALQWLKVQ
jgi:hypothetical protein